MSEHVKLICSYKLYVAELEERIEYLVKTNHKLEDRLGLNCNCDEYQMCEKCDNVHDRDSEGNII